EEVNKENLSHNSPLGSSIVPTNKTLKVKENEVKDVSSWIKCKNKRGWAMTISLKHLKNLIAPKKRPIERKESKIEHVITRKVADLIITKWWNKWHSFFQEEIWLQCCNEGAKWEKQIDINPKKKETEKRIGGQIQKTKVGR
ncbi:37083_t:CDS:2, partial [Gigaspora margarita]